MFSVPLLAVYSIAFIEAKQVLCVQRLAIIISQARFLHYIATYRNTEQGLYKEVNAEQNKKEKPPKTKKNHYQCQESTLETTGTESNISFPLRD